MKDRTVGARASCPAGYEYAREKLGLADSDFQTRL